MTRRILMAGLSDLPSIGTYGCSVVPGLHCPVLCFIVHSIILYGTSGCRWLGPALHHCYHTPPLCHTPQLCHTPHLCHTPPYSATHHHTASHHHTATLYHPPPNTTTAMPVHCDCSHTPLHYVFLLTVESGTPQW